MGDLVQVTRTPLKLGWNRGGNGHGLRPSFNICALGLLIYAQYDMSPIATPLDPFVAAEWLTTE